MLECQQRSRKPCKEKPCKGCSAPFVPPTFRQRYCDSCRGQCAVPGCKCAVKARGFCGAHLWRVYAHGDAGQADLINKRQTGLCQVPGCVKPARTKDYCDMHYARVRAHGEPGSATRLTKKFGGPCAVDGCSRKVIGDGLCRMHYERRRNTGVLGGPNSTRQPSGAGHVSKYGYRTIMVNGRSIFEHRHIMETLLGRPLLRKESVHHKNGLRASNEQANLELWSKAQPAGQRVIDKVRFAIEMLRLYPEFAAAEGWSLVQLSASPAL